MQQLHADCIPSSHIRPSTSAGATLRPQYHYRLHRVEIPETAEIRIKSNQLRHLARVVR